MATSMKEIAWQKSSNLGRIIGAKAECRGVGSNRSTSGFHQTFCVPGSFLFLVRTNWQNTRSLCGGQLHHQRIPLQPSGSSSPPSPLPGSRRCAPPILRITNIHDNLTQPSLSPPSRSSTTTTISSSSSVTVQHHPPSTPNHTQPKCPRPAVPPAPPTSSHPSPPTASLSKSSSSNSSTTQPSSSS